MHVWCYGFAKPKLCFGLNFYITFLTQHFGFVHIWPKIGFKQPSIF